MSAVRGRLTAGSALVLITTTLTLAVASLPAVAASWTIVTSPSPSATANSLNGVSCVSNTSCVAVGYYHSNKLVAQTLVESWDGSQWSVVPSPDVTHQRDNDLNAVSCISETSCVAVGFYYSKTASRTLIESWNGTSWTRVPSPNRGKSDNRLEGVSCAATTTCEAVGFSVSKHGKPQRTLTESWNGTTWTVIPSPNGSSFNNDLHSVSCSSATSCMAVGAFDGTETTTLAESFDGTSWSLAPAANRPGSLLDELISVSCVSSTFCQAVGDDISGTTGNYETLAASWDGSGWTLGSTPNAGSQNSLSGVSCASTTSCTAVGYDVNFIGGLNIDQTLIASWDGTSWTQSSSPNQGTGNNVLSAVSCTSSSSCDATGYYQVSGTNGATLVEEYM